MSTTLLSGTFVCYRYAASVDDILEEEEHYADQLKEYLFYADAVRYSIHFVLPECPYVKEGVHPK